MIAITQFLLGAAVIIVAGTFLSHFADVIAERTGLGRLFIGTILLAAGTSLPELSVDISAARMNLPDVAVGDLMGSSLMNLAILGFLDLLPASRGRMLSRVSLAHALPGTLSITLTALATMAIATRTNLGLFKISVGSVALVLAYAYGMRMVYRDQRLAAPMHTADPSVAVEASEPGTLMRAVAGFAAAALVIVLAAPFLAEAAGLIAETTGLGGTFVGTTLVALSTSLPELVASLAAIRMGAPDLAMGNIFGSNVFNMVLLLPIDIAYTGSLFADISAAHALTGLAVIVITSLVVMGQVYQVEKRVRLVEPDGLLILILVLGSLVMVFLND